MKVYEDHMLEKSIYVEEKRILSQTEAYSSANLHPVPSLRALNITLSVCSTPKNLAYKH